MNANELIEYIRGHPSIGFHPVPFHNKDGNLIEWFWKDERSYGDPIYVDGKWVGSLQKSMETDEVIGVSIHLEAAGVKCG